MYREALDCHRDDFASQARKAVFEIHAGNQYLLFARCQGMPWRQSNLFPTASGTCSAFSIGRR